MIGPTLADTSAAATRLTEALGNDPRIGRLDTDVELQQPQLAIDIDRAAAARYGLSTQTITDAIDLLSAGKVAARFSENGERYDIEVKAAESALTRPESLGAVYLRGSKGDLVRLDFPDGSLTATAVIAPDRSRALYSFASVDRADVVLLGRLRFAGLDPDRPPILKW